MNHHLKTTLVTKKQAQSSRKWFLFDATGQTLGRFAAEIARILTGKHRPDYTPNIDTGDGVVIVNAEKIHVTGMKRARKIYRNYTGFMGGLREVNYQTMLDRKPTEPIRRAVHGMMAKSRLGRQQMKKLRIHAGPEHDSHAQQPITVTR